MSKQVVCVCVCARVRMVCMRVRVVCVRARECMNTCVRMSTNYQILKLKGTIYIRLKCLVTMKLNCVMYCICTLGKTDMFLHFHHVLL